MKKYDYYEICKQKLKYENYSINTEKIYLHYIDEFFNNINTCPSRLNSEHFQNYLYNYEFTTVSQQNQIISAIKFLYKHVLDKKYEKVCFDRPRSEKKLPQIIDSEELLNSISKIENLKHKAIISIIFYWFKSI